MISTAHIYWPDMTWFDLCFGAFINRFWRGVFGLFQHELGACWKTALKKKKKKCNVKLMGQAVKKKPVTALSFSNVRTALETRWKAMHWLSQREPLRGPNWVDMLMWESLSCVIMCAVHTTGSGATWYVEGRGPCLRILDVETNRSFYIFIYNICHSHLLLLSLSAFASSAGLRSLEIGWVIEPNDTFQHHGTVPQ